MGTKTQKLSNVVDQIVEWQSVFTGDGSTGLTAVAGRGYFINTTSGTVTVTLPASPKAGDIVQLKDYARTWGTNNVTTASALVDGNTNTSIFSTSGQTVTLVYMDGTKGWSLINDDTVSLLGPSFITATGGTVTTTGDYKIHTFTGDGNFCVSSLGSGIPCAQASTVSYLVVAGGGGGGASAGTDGAGAGGGGGFREAYSPCNAGPYTASPLATPTALTVTAQNYPITVGGGGTPGDGPSNNAGTNGSDSVFSTITSAGGGGGAGPNSPGPGGGSSGGSGGGGAGGAGYDNPAGSGNTPPVSPPQGQPGGNSVAAPNGPPDAAAGGGGGATAAGEAGGILGRPAGPGGGGHGGDGAGTLINPATGETGPGPSQYYAGGGGGSASGACSGGLGGGGDGGEPAGGAGTANTGGGAGGSSNTSGSGSGGKGIVIIRYKYQ